MVEVVCVGMLLPFLFPRRARRQATRWAEQNIVDRTKDHGNVENNVRDDRRLGRRPLLGGMGGEWSNASNTTSMSEVYVKTLTGETVTLDVDITSDTVDDLKVQLEGKQGTPVSQQHLVCDGNELLSGTPLSQYPRLTRSTIRLLPRPSE